MAFKRIVRFIAFFLVAAFLIVSLAACTRAASKGITGTSEATGNFPVPEEESMGTFDISATQTAEALLPPASDSTNPVAVTATPLPTEPPPATAVPQANLEPTEGPLPTTYTIQKGEFPFCIARRYNVNQNELLALNGLGLNSQVVTGTTLKIPQTGNPFVTERSLKTHPAQYTVVSGDTIYTVACKFGDVGPDMIILANNLASPYTLTAGQTIQIP
jgi:LysM repeat protein